MKKERKAVRYLVTVLAVLGLIGTLGAIKFKQISTLIAGGAAMQKMGPPPESVGSAIAKQETWSASLKAVGSVAAAKGVTLSNDAPGVVTHIYFDSGAMVKQGQLLVELDNNVERAQFASAKARKELAAVNAGRSRTLVGSGSLAASQLDDDEAQVKTSAADMNAFQAQIARKVVRAPFSGKVGIRQVNVGQYLSPGTAIAGLESADAVFVDFALPQQRLDKIALGTAVNISIGGSDHAPFEGKISAIDPTVDPVTRSIKLRASVPSSQENLLPGMFANVEVMLPEQLSVVTVPTTAIVRASYGDSVFVVEDKSTDPDSPSPAPGAKPAKVAKQHFVRTGTSRGDFTSILDGVKAGQEVVTAGAFKLRNGASVVINNDVKPTPQLAPRPENR